MRKLLGTDGKAELLVDSIKMKDGIFYFYVINGDWYGKIENGILFVKRYGKYEKEDPSRF
jgi:hypothetical protein